MACLMKKEGVKGRLQTWECSKQWKCEKDQARAFKKFEKKKRKAMKIKKANKQDIGEEVPVVPKEIPDHI